MARFSFNPLAIGSNVLICVRDPQKPKPVYCFNPLAIGSNVLIWHSPIILIGSIVLFQSPSNRVKCSDLAFTHYPHRQHCVLFQSPSNRVKCSDLRISRTIST